jgi:anti-sigma regulatory factor (Ser/Thr protein kinase)
MTYELTLPPTVESVGAGRHLVDAALSEWDLDDLAYTAALLTSEVLTNCVLHARTQMVLTLERAGPGSVCISVHDGSAVLPRRRRHARDATTGRGLALLDRLAQSWDVKADGDGKTLTFVVGGDNDPWAEFDAATWMDAEL